MSVKVVDASAVSALLFGESKAGRVAEDLKGSGLAAPVLLDYEVSSVCLKKILKHPERRAAIIQAYRILPRISVERYGVDTEAAMLLAKEMGLSVYDASYLWLARVLRADLVTLDRRLASAFKRMRGNP